ncbi:Multi antimicrobial extrusion protein [Trypanosoma melophagium]|uniref:Multi antimicrobial extrusion protein n=1 Tax=Trypanosoma melophagium TaxID=715481 RepID=UPI00351AAF31|nr:Multi antimicrobial extrusion protein [Trypanosoma melophagium]
MPSLNNSFVSEAAQHVNLPESVPLASIFKRIILISIPLNIAQLAQFSINVAIIAVVGQLGVNELGGASLAYGLINATAFAFASGFCGALETVLSHTYGRDPKSKMYGIYSQRMSLILLIVGLLLSPIILFVDRLLLLVGQTPEVVKYTGEFCRIAVWGLFPVMALELLRRYFACQHLNKVLSINLTVAAVLFPFLLVLLVKLFGFFGAPFGWCVLMTCMSGSLWLYLVITRKYKDTWGGWDDAAYRNWGPLLALAIPSMAMMLSEWVALEINNICAGFGTPEELAAFGITFQLSGVCWSNAAGTYIAASVLVGNAIGEGKPLLARKIAFCALITTVSIALLNLIIVTLVKDLFPYIFTDSEEVVSIVHSLLKYFFVYHTFDAFQSCMMGVLRGCGMQKQGAIVILFVYSIVGVPLGVFLFLKTSFGIEALWLGPATGVTLVGFPCYVYMLFRLIKWESLKVHTDHRELDNVIEQEREEADSVVICSSPSVSNMSLAGDAEGSAVEGKNIKNTRATDALTTPPAPLAVLNGNKGTRVDPTWMSDASPDPRREED